MSLDMMVAKIAFALITGIILVWVVSPAIAVIGMVTCPNCNPFINAFIFVVVPVGLVFIGIYKVMGIFSRRAGQ